MLPTAKNVTKVASLVRRWERINDNVRLAAAELERYITDSSPATAYADLQQIVAIRREEDSVYAYKMLFAIGDKYPNLPSPFWKLMATIGLQFSMSDED